jgi:hypothetical protein
MFISEPSFAVKYMVKFIKKTVDFLQVKLFGPLLFQIECTTSKNTNKYQQFFS